MEERGDAMEEEEEEVLVDMDEQEDMMEGVTVDVVDVVEEDGWKEQCQTACSSISRMVKR